MLNATQALLDRLSEQLGGVSDYRLSKTLGITPQRISMYRNGHRQFDDSTAVKVSELLNISAGQVLAELQAERAKDSAVAAVWHQVARAAAAAKAASLAIAVAILSVMGLAAPSPAEASRAGVSWSQQLPDQDIHYAQWSDWPRALLDLLAGLFWPFDVPLPSRHVS